MKGILKRNAKGDKLKDSKMKKTIAQELNYIRCK